MGTANTADGKQHTIGFVILQYLARLATQSTNTANVQQVHPFVVRIFDLLIMLRYSPDKINRRNIEFYARTLCLTVNCVALLVVLHV